MSKRYAWVNDEWHPPIDADVAARCVEAANRDPRQLLDAARNADHPFHAYYEWNDGIAADRYRLEQSRRYISLIREVDGDAPPRPAFIVVRDEQTGRKVYAPTVVIDNDPQARTYHLLREIGRIASFIDRIASCPEAAPLVRAVAEARGLVLAGDEPQAMAAD